MLFCGPQQLLELSISVHLLNNVCTPHQLAIHVQLCDHHIAVSVPWSNVSDLPICAGFRFRIYEGADLQDFFLIFIFLCRRWSLSANAHMFAPSVKGTWLQWRCTHLGYCGPLAVGLYHLPETWIVDVVQNVDHLEIGAALVQNR